MFLHLMMTFEWKFYQIIFIFLIIIGEELGGGNGKFWIHEYISRWGWRFRLYQRTSTITFSLRWTDLITKLFRDFALKVSRLLHKSFITVQNIFSKHKTSTLEERHNEQCWGEKVTSYFCNIFFFTTGSDRWITMIWTIVSLIMLERTSPATERD